MGTILLFLFTKKTKLLIIKDILNKIITFRLYKANINIDTVFINFLYIKEIIYPNKKAKDFSTIRALYSNIKIASNIYLIVFYLK